MMHATNTFPRRYGKHWSVPSITEKNRSRFKTSWVRNMGPLVIILIIAGIFMVLLFCISLTILTLLIHKKVNTINIRLQRIMSAMQIREDSGSEEKGTPKKDKKGLQLDDRDIQKLKNIGVGMD
jgi:hypothetical protein